MEPTDLIGARVHRERALEIGQATLGPDHPTMAILRRNLDAVLQQTGDEQRRGYSPVVRGRQVSFEDVMLEPTGAGLPSVSALRMVSRLLAEPLL